MQIEINAKPEKRKASREIKKDLKTCLIMAGCSGAGKSSIVKYSHALDVKLFGDELHEDFKRTKGGDPHQEFDDYTEAIKNGATFEGRHIKDLSNEKTPPKHILMHLDLKLLIHKLGYSAASKSDRARIELLTKLPTPTANKTDPEICDLMISSFLRHKFFSRFEYIAVNTVYTNHNTNQLQARRRNSPDKNIKLKKASRRYAKEHQAMYKAWEKNIHLLQPSKIFFTTANEDGDLYSNNQCICKNWSQKAGLAH